MKRTILTKLFNPADTQQNRVKYVCEFLVTDPERKRLGLNPITDDNSDYYGVKDGKVFLDLTTEAGKNLVWCAEYILSLSDFSLNSKTSQLKIVAQKETNSINDYIAENAPQTPFPAEKLLTETKQIIEEFKCKYFCYETVEIKNEAAWIADTLQKAYKKNNGHLTFSHIVSHLKNIDSLNEQRKRFDSIVAKKFVEDLFLAADNWCNDIWEPRRELNRKLSALNQFLDKLNEI